MLFLIIAWSLLLMISFQVGSTILDLSKSDSFKRVGDRFIISVWLGIIILSNALLAISVFTRLSLLVVFVLSVGLVIFSLRLRRKNYVKAIIPYLSLSLIVGFIALLIGISFVTTQVVTWYDTGLYHFGAIKWLSRYGTVPGLGLIYYGFGYATSWYALAAPFNDWIFDARASILTGGFAFLMVVLHLWICLVRVFTNRAKTEDWFVVISSLLALAVITRYEIYISPSTDLPVIILTIVTAWAIIIIVKQRLQILPKDLSIKLPLPHPSLPIEGGGVGKGCLKNENSCAIKLDNGIVPLILSAGAVSIKLSAMPILLVSVFFYLFLHKFSIRRILSGTIIILLLLLPFFTVQAIISGCLLYPSSFMSLDLPWTIGAEKIKAVSEQLRKVALWSTITPPDDNSWKWLLQWPIIEKFQTALILLTAFFFFPSIKELRNGHLNWAKWPLAIGIIGFFFTMVSGPTWRYSLGYLAVMSSIFISLHCNKPTSVLRRGLSYLTTRISSKSVMAILLFILGITIPMISIMVNNLKAFNYLRMEIHEAIRKGDLSVNIYNKSRILLPPKLLNFQLGVKNSKKPLFTLSDLELVEQKVNDIHFYKPKEGYQCWNAGLPCTQFLTYDNIRLRNPEGGIGKGFVRMNDE